MKFLDKTLIVEPVSFLNLVFELFDNFNRSPLDFPESTINWELNSPFGRRNPTWAIKVVYFGSTWVIEQQSNQTFSQLISQAFMFTSCVSSARLVEQSAKAKTAVYVAEAAVDELEKLNKLVDRMNNILASNFD